MKCPGVYCGRIFINQTLVSDCGVCPRGFRSSSSIPASSGIVRDPFFDESECLPCDDLLTLHDWIYLLFMSIILLLIEWYIIDYSIKRRNLPIEVLFLHMSAGLEVTAASLITVTMYSDGPDGLFDIRSCNVHRLSDWYTIFWNPSPDYKSTIRCSGEAVYPLFSMVFVLYAMSLIFLLTIRPFVVWKTNDKNASTTIYLSLYVIPGLTVIHAIFSGIIYYLFPYITIIGSVFSLAVHLSCRLDQRMSALFRNSIRDVRSATILVGHWFLHSLGIIAVTQIKNPLRDTLFLLIVPFPTLFYFLTSRFTDPSKLQLD